MDVFAFWIKSVSRITGAEKVLEQGMRLLLRQSMKKSCPGASTAFN